MGKGASASQTGPSQAEPKVSALRASVPCAVRSSTATYSDLRPIPAMTREQMLRFESKVIEDSNGCWRWQGTRNHGRPYFKLNGHAYFAQRVMFAETFGHDAVAGRLAIRTCGEADCVNPDHIETGDEQALADARKRYGGYTAWGGKRAGERNPNAKYSDREIAAMRGAEGSLSEVASRFGASPGYVWRVRVGLRRIETGTAGPCFASRPTGFNRG